MSGTTGPGVDALQANNLKRSEATPLAILKDGKWFEPSEEAKAAALLIRLETAAAPAMSLARPDEAWLRDLDSVPKYADRQVQPHTGARTAFAGDMRNWLSGRSLFR